MNNPAELSSHDFKELCERTIKEYTESNLAITQRIVAEHGVPFATWINTDAMTRTLATYCMMHSDPNSAARQVIAKFMTNLEILMNAKQPTLPKPTHPAPGVSQ